jgi:hypothetical protein
MPQDESAKALLLGSSESQVDYSAVLEDLQHATPFDLYRLRSALDRMLDDPATIARAKRMVHVGDEVEYFENQENRSVKARVLRCNRTRAVVQNLDDGRKWQVAYTSINTSGVSTAIHERPTTGLGRNEVSVGDRVGFVDRKDREHYGTIVKLNQKTVTLICDDDEITKWRVSYSYLFRVLSADGTSGPMTAVDALPFRPNSGPK